MLSVLKRKASATISPPGPTASTHPTTTTILYPLPYGYVALTPQQMIAKIVEMTNNTNPGGVLGNDVLCNILPNHPSPQISGTKRKADNDDDDEYTEVEAGASKPSHAASEGNKDLFQTTMMIWTANNMSNPYPDDTMVIHISNFLVNNWLVNSRVRKWRPAIQAAFDLCRPASILLEDSKALFEGREVRPLPLWDTSLFSSFTPLLTDSTTKTKKTKANKVLKLPKVPKPRGRPRKNKVVPIMDAIEEEEDSKSFDLGDLLTNMVTFDDDGLADGIDEEFDFLPEGDVEAV